MMLSSTLLSNFPIFIYLQALEVAIWRDGNEYSQKYSRGKPVTALLFHELPSEFKDRQGTRIQFWPDKEGQYFVKLFHF